MNSISIDINVDSIRTQFEKSTTHLKNADFFGTTKFPTARFVSTEIKNIDKCKVTGNLTLHGQTKPVSFPASYRFGNGGLLLDAKYSLDRSRFGMDQMLRGVDKLVEIEISIGQNTTPLNAPKEQGGDSKMKQ